MFAIRFFLVIKRVDVKGLRLFAFGFRLEDNFKRIRCRIETYSSFNDCYKNVKVFGNPKTR